MKQSSEKITIEKQPSDLFDWATFLLTILILAGGLISIYSATYDSGSSSFFYRQLAYTIVGFVVLFITMYLPERWLNSNTIIFYGLSLLFLIVVMIWGTEKFGTKGWLEMGSMSVQPAEFAKLTSLMMVAGYLSKKGTDIRTLRDLAVVGFIIACPIALIALQPDIGTASVLIAILLGVMLWTGFDIFILFMIVSLPIIIILSFLGIEYFVASVSIFTIIAALFRKKVLITIAAVIIVAVVGYSSPKIIDNLAPHQQDRIETFLNPGSDPRGKGYNVIQSILAVGSGGMTGKGFLQGTQTQLRYIPMQWTDFIFCVPTEEFGFVGGVAVIMLLAGLMFRAIKIASEINSKYMSIIAIGIASVFFYHSLINIGMSIGMMPVMGIPLPFMSAGGTALIVNMAFIGLLMNAYRTHRKRNT